MNTDQVKGLPVISVADGERLGTVSRVYLDPVAMKITGFAFDAGGGIFDPERTPIVDVGNVRSLGHDTLILADKHAVHGEQTEGRYAELIEIGDLVNRTLMTKDGRDAGKLVALTFDEQTFKVTALNAAHGRFNRDHTTIPIGSVVTIGPDYVILAATPEAEAAAPQTSADSVHVVHEDASSPRISAV